MGEDRGWKSFRPTGRGRKGPTGSKACNRVVYLCHPQVLGCPSPEARWPRVIRKNLHLLWELNNDLFSDKCLFTLHWVQMSFPLGILQSSATNPLLTIQDDLLDEAWPHLKVRRESGSGNLLLPRWSISGGVSADRNVILGQGRRNGLVSSWEGNFHWQHVIPFATGLHCCGFLPTLSWTLNKRIWLR